jgi:hypothetical protein
MEGAFGNDFVGFEERVGLSNAVALLEILHSSPEGSTIGYKKADGHWIPETLRSSVEQSQHERLVRPFQDAAIRGIREIFTRGGFGELSFSDLETAAGLSAIERVALSPSSEELRYLGSLQHSSSIAHGQFTSLIPLSESDTSGTTVENEINAPWPMGSVLTTLKRFPACEGSSKRRAALAREMSFWFKGLNLRTRRTLE